MTEDATITIMGYLHVGSTLSLIQVVMFGSLFQILSVMTLKMPVQMHNNITELSTVTILNALLITYLLQVILLKIKIAEMDNALDMNVLEPLQLIFMLMEIRLFALKI